MSRQEMFREYPDVVNIEQLCEMLGGVSVKTAYQRLHSGELAFFRIGRGFRIPKEDVIRFVRETSTRIKDV